MCESDMYARRVPYERAAQCATVCNVCSQCILSPPATGRVRCVTKPEDECPHPIVCARTGKRASRRTKSL
jgi:hypothetical protein